MFLNDKSVFLIARTGPELVKCLQEPQERLSRGVEWAIASPPKIVQHVATI